MSIVNIMSKRVVSVHMDDSLQSLRELFAATGFHHLIVITLSPHDSVYSAISLFNTHKISCIPIIDKDRHSVGMVSWRDVMKFMQSRVEAKR